MKTFKIYIDQKPFTIEEKLITGAEIKAKVGAPANYGVWLKVDGRNPDKEISSNEQVDLNQPYRTQFFTGSTSTLEG